MKWSIVITGMLFLSILTGLPSLAQQSDDPYLWLEDVEGEKSLEWVKQRNRKTVEALQKNPEYQQVLDRSLEILTSDERIAYPSIRGDYLYNFWQDDEHERGIWRRTTWDSYLSDQPEWEILLDIDALSEKEGTTWAYKGVNCLPPEYERCLVSLAPGGSDASEIREFDAESKQFVEGGYFLPVAKSNVAWIDENTVLVATDFGEGSLTTSGYARIVKRWKRGTPLAEAEKIFEAKPEDMIAAGYSIYTDGETFPIVAHRVNFYEGTYFLVRGDELIQLDVPIDSNPSLYRDHLLLYLRSPWTVGGKTYPQGAVIAIGREDFLQDQRDFQIIAEPTERQTVEGFSTTEDYVLVNLLNNVQGELYRYKFNDGKWSGERIPAPELGSVNVVASSEETDRFFFTYSSYLQPTTLYLTGEDEAVQPVKQLPAMFDATGFVVHQHEATSKDSTRIPYFVVHKEGVPHDGSNPTLLYAYGGFQVSQTPGYSPIVGSAWLERGGVYVVANLRGGGEFGPAWHRAALKENRQRAFDDFFAVAESVIEHGITSPEHLGIMGGSNGGLLVGAALTQRPELFGAVVVTVPLLDMQRYHKLLAGASWMAEYGNPDIPEEWAYISRYSPYQNVHPNREYPPVLFYTTTRDDRVHPGHARKMAAKMEEMGHPIYYFENTEGGHGAGVTPEQQARMQAIIYTFLLEQLK